MPPLWPFSKTLIFFSANISKTLIPFRNIPKAIVMPAATARTTFLSFLLYLSPIFDDPSARLPHYEGGTGRLYICTILWSVETMTDAPRLR